MKIITRILGILVVVSLLIGTNTYAQHPYQDLTHKSAVFGHEKYYRRYLPAGYGSSKTRYPIIYFFHGWGGRYFKDDNAKLDYDRIQTLVDKYNVILVMWDGNIEPDQPRPYNVGNHEDIRYQVQFKDYFPELVAHIDSTCRTLADRDHRGIIGFSMGGFMALYLSGKYPDMVCAMTSFAGSPEFFVGYPDNHTLYPVRYTFKNLREVNVRQHNGNSDILYNLNEEVHEGALWEDGPYEYWQFRGGHMVDPPGRINAYEKAVKFVADNFKVVHPQPASWSHYDVYDTFHVWGYQVQSNKSDPGFLFLKNVDAHGFGFQTPRWLPDGPPNKNIKATVTTAPAYQAHTVYRTVSYSFRTGQITINDLGSDGEGRLKFSVDGAGTETGIFLKDDFPEYVFLDYSINEIGRFLQTTKENQLRLRLFNRGGEQDVPLHVRVHFQCGDKTIVFPDSVIEMTVLPGQRIVTLPPLKVVCTKLAPVHAEPWEAKIRLRMEISGHSNEDELIVPVLFDVAAFGNTLVDDGKAIRDSTFGTGNGDGKVEAGEHVLLYEGTHRLKIYTDDPWVDRDAEQRVDEMIPAIWPDGFTTHSVIAISPDCPEGHLIRALACYETKTYNPIDRQVHWGLVTIKVTLK